MVTEFSPAKINLFLAVTGRRADGFHDLVSVVVPLEFGDELIVGARGKGEEARGAEGGARRGKERTGGSGQTSDGSGAQFSLECDEPAVPVDERNLVLQAAKAFAAATGFGGRVNFSLKKRIPMGAGLGGGSSNAVAALRALHGMSERRLAEEELVKMAAGLGSDCALFLRKAPVVMRGRGDLVEALPEAAVRRLRGRRVCLFKPSFGIATPWAYRRMAERGGDYVPSAEAEARLADWVTSGAVAEQLLFNNLEPAAFEKYPALPLLLEKLRREFGVAAAMSGSGSACFALMPETGKTEEMVTGMKQRIRECWGEAAWVQGARIG